MQQALEALENAVRYHGIMLMADPPQDAWKYHRVEDNAKQAITALREALAQPVQEPCIGKDSRCPCQDGHACHYKDCGGTKAWPVPQAEPVSCRFCHDARGCWTWQCYHCGEIDDVQKPAPLPVQEPTDIAALVEGMEVSIDVSTGEHDSDSRLFGTVTLAQENQGSKHGLILLIQDAEPNFQPAPPVQEPVAWTTMPEADDWDFVSGNKDPTGKLEGKWFPLYTAPPAVERPWVGLKEKNK
jgi:hypothetical protein